MNSYSHIRIGRIVLNKLQHKYGISLPTVAFLWANCKPDYSIKYKKIPHYKKSMEKEFKLLVEEVLLYKWDNKNIFLIADRLGVICHFICDFFCYAHSPSFSGGLKGHISYEAKVNKFIKENPALLENWASFDNCLGNKTIEDLLYWFDRRYERYILTPNNAACDVEFSIGVSLELTSRLLDLILCNSQVISNCAKSKFVSI